MKTIYYIIIGIVIAAIGTVSAIGYHNSSAKQEQFSIRVTLDGYSHQFTDAGFDMAFKLKNAQQDSTVYSYLCDKAAKEYLLETSRVFTELYNFIGEKNLKDVNPEYYSSAISELTFAFGNQAKVIKGINDPALQKRAISILKSELKLLDNLGQGMEKDIVLICNELDI